MPLHTYRDALNFLLEFTDYEKVTKYKYDIATFNLGRVEDLMAAVGDPHRAFRSAHIAGTKGKGSTASMVQSILTAAGLRTGLYTSPHLCRLEERMTIDGELVSEDDLVATVNELVPYTRRQRSEKPNESPTYFELVTAAAFRHFARMAVDFAVVEVGLGGRLDATNVVLPEVSVITRVDFDHVERLGDTLAKIAFEKAGIVKRNVPVICCPQAPEALETIAAIAEEREAPMTLVGREYRIENIATGTEAAGAFTRFDLAAPGRRLEQLGLRLLGVHQAYNAAAAVAAVETLSDKRGLGINEETIRTGLAAAGLPARLEYFPGEPPVLLDGAHNPISIRGLCETLAHVFPDRSTVMALGFSRDKDAPAMLRDLLPRARRVIFTRSDSPRAEAPDALAEIAREICGKESEVVENPREALARARDMARPDGLVVITGSFFLAGNLRPLLLPPHAPARSPRASV